MQAVMEHSISGPRVPRWVAGVTGFLTVATAGLFLGRTLLGAAPTGPIREAKGIFVPARSEGEAAFTLHPVEGVTPNQSRRVSFGVPFPRGWMTDPHRLRVLDPNRRELRLAVRLLSPWRDLGTLQMVPSARSLLVQTDVTFPDTDGDFRPAPVQLTLEWGKTERERSADLAPVPVRDTWVSVNDDSYPSSAKVSEPAAYAVFGPEWYGQCVLKSRLLPLGTHPEFSTYDALFPLFAETAANRVDPRVAAANKSPYLTEHEPWLYDRAMTLYQLAFRSGDVRWLREAHRAAQFYAGHIDGKGFFDLKEGDLKYSYVECLATNYWLTGDPRNLEAAERVIDAWRHFDMLYTPANLERHWTERHAGFKLLAVTAGYELSGAEEVGREAQQAFEALLKMQENPIPGAPKTGALLHTALSHDEGEVHEIIASPWMSTLLVDAVQRYYTHSADPRAGGFVRKMADFFRGPLSLYWSTEYDRSRRLFPFYLSQTDKKPKADVWEDKEHPLDVSKIFALAYFFSRIDGEPDPSYLTPMSDLLKTHQEAIFPEWIRPAGVADGQTVFRVNPPRKFGWWFRTTADMDWLIGAETPLAESEDEDGARLTLTLTSDAAQVRPGQDVTYTLRYRASGSSGAASVLLQVPLFSLNTRSDVSVGSLSDGGKETTNDLLWKLGDVPAGSSGAVTFRVRVKPYPAPPTARQPIAPILTRATAYYCRPGHTVFNGCQPLRLDGASGTYCHTSLSNMLVAQRPARR